MKLNYIFLLFVLFYHCQNNPDSNIETQEEERDYTSFFNEAKTYVDKNNYNSDYFFLLDFKKHPGKFRFYVYDFNENKIIDEALVTHGACDAFNENPEKWEKAKFSNVPNSHCSSKGKYVLGERAVSGWGIGIKYWLKGLETTNNKAVERFVVLHSWEAVKDRETYPNPIALSWGCPAVSNQFMTKLDQKIQASGNKKILLWIID